MKKETYINILIAFGVISGIFFLFLLLTVAVTGVIAFTTSTDDYSRLMSGVNVMLMYAIPLIIVIYLIHKIFKIKFHDEFTTVRIRDFFLVLLAYFFLLNAINILTAFLPEPGEQLKMILDLILKNPFWSFIVLVIIAPVLEEILFRGTILKHLLKKFPPLTAILISSVAFGLFHMNIWQALGAILMGMYFGYLYWRTGSLLLPILLHFITNLIGYITALVTKSMHTGFENFSTWELVFFLILNLFLFYLLFKKLDERLRQYPLTVYLASGNAHKLEEIKSVLPENIKLKSLKDLKHTSELSETGQTLEENSLEKARQIARQYGVNVLADDTGLEVDSLNGAPGVYSSRYAGENATPADNRKKLLEELKDKENRKARFRTVITYIKDNETHQFEGIVEGKITEKESGEHGFGYDSIFVPQGSQKTFAEMSLEEKNQFSHRARALEKLKNFLRKQ